MTSLLGYASVLSLVLHVVIDQRRNAGLAVEAFVPCLPSPLVTYSSFSRTSESAANICTHKTILFGSFDDSNEDEDEDEDFDDGQEDWRAFRARLVSMERQSRPPTNDDIGMTTSPNQQHIENHLDKNDVNDVKNTSDEREKQSKSPSSNQSWAYESGSTIEPGTIILHHPPTSSSGIAGGEFGYGLGKQYLHKSVILILEHDTDGDFTTRRASSSGNHQPTRGVILNRPTDLHLHDSDPNNHGSSNENNNDSWNVWFGGNEWGLHTPEPKFYCLHSGLLSSVSKDDDNSMNLTSEELRRRKNNKRILELSRPILKGVYFTSFQNAQALVEEGIATRNDFWVFCGFVAWGPGELIEELLGCGGVGDACDIEDDLDDDDYIDGGGGMWHAVSTDGKTLKKGMRILNAGNSAASIDPRDGGVRTWSMLMEMIGRGDVVKSITGGGRFASTTFDDLMLREWASRYLMFKDPPLFLQLQQRAEEDNNNQGEGGEEEFMVPELTGTVSPGTILRGSSASRSPFILSDQEFHKSLLLVVQDDELSVGILLNHPSARTIDLMAHTDSASYLNQEEQRSLPLRFGGALGGPIRIPGVADSGDNPLFVLHMSAELRKARVGKPVGHQFPAGIWKCSAEDAAEAIANNMATPQDFLVIDGFCVWTKEVDEKGNARGGVFQEVLDGKFEIVSQVHTQDIWNTLKSQEVLSSSTVDKNVYTSNLAWNISCGRNPNAGRRRDMNNGRTGYGSSGKNSGNEHFNPSFGNFHGNGKKEIKKVKEFKEEDQTCVFNSDVRVSVLGDVAQKTWIKAFLLGELRP